MREADNICTRRTGARRMETSGGMGGEGGRGGDYMYVCTYCGEVYLERATTRLDGSVAFFSFLHARTHK